ncbi:MAG TPA: IS630 family transposase [Chloroflexota bacterium]|nr:IS630 family transposase [Chloroflexota bacterium]
MRSPDAFVLRRTQILLASARGEQVGAIAAVVGYSGQAVRQVIHAFEQEGLGVLEQRPRTPHTLYYCFDTSAAEHLREQLHQSPRSYGKETGLWTLELAAEVAFEQGLTAWRVSDETVRATLARMGVRWQRAKQWIHSPDPEYARKKARRDRLIRLAERNEDLLLGFLDEVWWSRLARPTLYAWQDPLHPLRLVEQTVAAADPDPKALACYGLLARSWQEDGRRTEAMWLRFVDGRPVSAVTVDFLAWCAAQAAVLGKRAVLLIWDNASWHESQIVRTWLRAHNRQVKQAGRGVRLIVCFLPVKSPWLNPIEPKWLHGKKRVAEPDRLLAAAELADRVCATYDCPHYPHLVQPPRKEAAAKSKKVA